MNLVKYIIENARSIDDEFILDEIGKDKQIIGFDAVTLEHILDGFIRNKLEVECEEIGMLPTYDEDNLEEQWVDAVKQGIYPLPKAIAVEVEIVVDYDESEDEDYTFTHIQLEPFYTVQALKFFNTLPQGEFADDDLVTSIFGGNGESTELLLELLLGEVPESEDRDSEYMAKLLSRALGTPVEFHGYLSTELEEGMHTLAVFSLSVDAR